MVWHTGSSLSMDWDNGSGLWMVLTYMEDDVIWKSLGMANV